MDMRTPLGKVRGLGSAKDGTEHFWRQRVTAVANVPLFLFFIIFMIIHAGQPYAEVYVHHEVTKIALVMLNTFFSILMAGLCLFAILKIAFVG
jgi:succinate dehydrogenase / fumarate reductase membrane anchor subunit